LVRRPNGAPDKSFSGDGLAVYRFAGIDNSAAYDLAIQPDGKIVVAGEGYDNGVSPQAGFFEIARLRPNGALDKTFSGDGLAKIDFAQYDEGVWKVKLLHDGTIVVAGWMQNKAGTEWNSAVAELKPGGALDRSFSGDGKATFNFLKGADDYPLGLDIRSGGAILLGLYRHDASSYLAAVAQLRPGGGLDGSFGGGDGLKTGLGPDLDVQDLIVAGGKILLAGGTGSGSSPFVLRLASSGNLDGTFGNHGQADLSAVSGYLFDIAVDSQGRVVGVGNAVSDGLVLRLHA
jgi:uncharacterized delta-60 repeat protein